VTLYVLFSDVYASGRLYDYPVEEKGPVGNREIGRNET
jgi:hypothetical protein